MSKKAKRALDRSRRGTWGPQSQVTRTVESKKRYDRKKNRWDEHPADFFIRLSAALLSKPTATSLRTRHFVKPPWKNVPCRIL